MPVVEIRSLIAPPALVSIDPYGRNPLAEDYRQVNKTTYDLAVSKAGMPPKMFTGGTADLPLFTASGLDVALLLKLPYGARHYAASLTDPGVLHAFYELHADDPYAHVQHEGLEEAVRRVRDWASGRMDRDETDSVDIDAVYGRLFGEVRT